MDFIDCIKKTVYIKSLGSINIINFCWFILHIWTHKKINDIYWSPYESDALTRLDCSSFLSLYVMAEYCVPEEKYYHQSIVYSWFPISARCTSVSASRQECVPEQKNVTSWFENPDSDASFTETFRLFLTVQIIQMLFMNMDLAVNSAFWVKNMDFRELQPKAHFLRRIYREVGPAFSRAICWPATTEKWKSAEVHRPVKRPPADATANTWAHF